MIKDARGQATCKIYPEQVGYSPDSIVKEASKHNQIQNLAGSTTALLAQRACRAYEAYGRQEDTIRGKTPSGTRYGIREQISAFNNPRIMPSIKGWVRRLSAGKVDDLATWVQMRSSRVTGEYEGRLKVCRACGTGADDTCPPPPQRKQE